MSAKKNRKKLQRAASRARATLLQDRRGMSLIEVMVAILLLGMVTVPLVGLFTAGATHTAVARHDVAAANLAQEVLEEIKSAPKDQIGTAQGGGNITIVLEPAAGSVENKYVGYTIALYKGPGAGQVRQIVGYNGTTATATVDREWNVVPEKDNTHYIIFKGVNEIYPYQVLEVATPSDDLITFQVTVSYQNRGQPREVSLVTDKLRR